jgi:hypothetical protein
MPATKDIVWMNSQTRELLSSPDQALVWNEQSRPNREGAGGQGELGDRTLHNTVRQPEVIPARVGPGFQGQQSPA